ncbi:hypothetical protein FOQG_02646 [Fusarium oxysporum f. sp. raphani 54005]|uniref:Uncharacterized protein n=1 Tax=Fusarium oxysporum f. sp. raphani 54005 TaxID=1089458 RepID=X0CSN4_FUSOX|nr:hypothetical protein FOQG_02646 [Fusarium oxysporum f. sp. raphani 54005]
MPGKASDWDNADFLLDLVVGLYTGAQVNGGLTPPVKQSIEEYIKGRGYTTSFDAVRQHVQKLRKNRDTTAIQNSGGSETGTPRKRSSSTKTPAKRTPKRNATKSASIVDEDEDLEDEKMQLKMETDDMDEELMSPKGVKRTKSEPEDEVTVGEV